MATVSITCLRDTKSGREWELEQGKSLTVGRNEGNDWVFASRSVSRNHAVLEWAEGSPRAFVQDLGSANGTRIDGELLSPHEPAILTHKSLLQFGELSFRIELLEKRVATSTSDEGPVDPQTPSGRFVRLVSAQQTSEGTIRHWDDLADVLLHLESGQRTGTLGVRLPHRTVNVSLVMGQIVAPLGGGPAVPEVLTEWQGAATYCFTATSIEVEATGLEAANVAPSEFLRTSNAATRRMARPRSGEEREIGDQTEITLDPARRLP